MTQQGVSLSQALVAQVLKHGSPEERRLVTAHQEPLARFLDHPDIQLQAKRTHLEMVLENRLSLGFNLVTTAATSPWRLINALGEWVPTLRNLAELVLLHRIRSHVGIRIRPERVEYELFVYETPGQILASQALPKIKSAKTGLPENARCYGYSSIGTLAAYAVVSGQNAALAPESQQLGLPCGGARSATLFSSILTPADTWKVSRIGTEYVPFPSHMLNAVLAGCDLHFSYLLHRGGARPYGIVGLNGSHQALHLNLLPQPTRTNSESSP